MKAVGGGAAKRTRERGIELPWLGALEGVEAEDESGTDERRQVDRGGLEEVGTRRDVSRVASVPSEVSDQGPSMVEASTGAAPQGGPTCPPGFRHVDPRRIGVTRKRRPKGATV